ncbi:hypothetical protein [Gloeothece verrucosa]|nr:hypothetical protein [Gloeothece verrucosa]
MTNDSKLLKLQSSFVRPSLDGLSHQFFLSMVKKNHFHFLIGAIRHAT